MQVWKRTLLPSRTSCRCSVTSGSRAVGVSAAMQLHCVLLLALWSSRKHVLTTAHLHSCKCISEFGFVYTLGGMGYGFTWHDFVPLEEGKTDVKISCKNSFANKLVKGPCQVQLKQVYDFQPGLLWRSDESTISKFFKVKSSCSLESSLFQMLCLAYGKITTKVLF